MERLSIIKEEQKSMATKELNDVIINQINERYHSSKKRIFFLDYDGTLTGFKTNPRYAKPDEELLTILTNLVYDKKNKVVIISGRDKNTLNSWLGFLPVDIIAEHGVWLKESGQEWQKVKGLSDKWKGQIRPVLELYVDRTPGSFIEEKDFSLVWHYRKVETGLGELRTRELTSHLKYLSSNKSLQVLEGDMVVEIKSALVNKGVATTNWLNRFESDFILAIGDDWTDEDTFKALPEDSFSIKVGSTSSEAKFHTETYKDVRKFLMQLVEE